LNSGVDQYRGDAFSVLKKVLETDRVVCFMQTNEGRIIPAKRGGAKMICKKIGIVHKRFFIDASQADQAV